MASMMSGLAANSANCASMESPPTSTASRRSVYRASSLTALCSWMTSSRVGASIRACAPAFGLCSFSLGVQV